MRAGLFLGVLGFGLLLTACGTDYGGGGSVTEADLTGKWTMNSMHEKGWTKTTPPGTTVNKDTTTTYTGTATTLEFKADKSILFTIGAQVSGTWSLSGKTLTTILIIPGFGSDTSKSDVSISGKTGTFVEHDTKTKTYGGITVEQDLTITVIATKQ